MGNFVGKKAYTLVLSSQWSRRPAYEISNLAAHYSNEKYLKDFPMTIDDIFSNSLTSILNLNENEVKYLPLNKWSSPWPFWKQI